MTKEKQISDLLETLEQELRSLGLWLNEPPSAEALSSKEPFAVDTLEPQEWLQWIFIARMRYMLHQGMPIPTHFSMTPYFEECWKQQASFESVLSIIKQFDEVASNA